MIWLCIYIFSDYFCNRGRVGTQPLVLYTTINTRPLAWLEVLLSQPYCGPRGRVRGEADEGLLPRALQALQPQAAGWAGGPGAGWELCSAELQSPRQGRPPARPRPWSSPEPLPHPGFRDLMVAAVSMGHSLWRPQQLDHMDTAIKVAASTSFSLSIQIQELVQFSSVIYP